MAEWRLALTVLAFVAAMVLAGVIGLTNRLGIAALALLSFAWLTLDDQFEGDKLIVFTKTHGLVSADLVGLLGLVCALALWWRSRKR